MGTIKVAVTGAAGQIAYNLLFEIARGGLFGEGQRVKLQLLELPQVIKAAQGVAMELIDCAFPLLQDVECFDDAKAAFDGVHLALLVGSKPRGPGMQRSDLIKANGPIFVEQGKALLKADNKVKVVVVGNPCNTNALIAASNAGDIPKENFSAMTALDENRGKSQLALKAKAQVKDVANLVIWGNHSNTMYPDYENALIDGKVATSVITDAPWFASDFIPTVQNRGAAIIAARGKSSAASAAYACVDHVKRFYTKSDKVFSAAVFNQKERFGVPKGLMYSFPLRSRGDFSFEIDDNVKLSAFAMQKIKESANELLTEKDLVKELLC